MGISATSRRVLVASTATSTVMATAYAILSSGLAPLPEEAAALAAIGIWSPEDPLSASLAHVPGIVAVTMVGMILGTAIGLLTERVDLSVGAIVTWALHPSTFAFSNHLRYAPTPEADGTPSMLGAVVSIATVAGIVLVGRSIPIRRGPCVTGIILVLLGGLWIPASYARVQSTLSGRTARANNLTSVLALVRQSPTHCVFLVPEHDGVEYEIEALVNATSGFANSDPATIPHEGKMTLAGLGPILEDGFLKNTAPVIRPLGNVESTNQIRNPHPNLCEISLRVPDDEPVFSAVFQSELLKSQLFFIAIATDSMGRSRLVTRALDRDILDLSTDQHLTTVKWRPSWRSSTGARELRWEDGELLPHGGVLRWTFAVASQGAYRCGSWSTITARHG